MEIKYLNGLKEEKILVDCGRNEVEMMEIKIGRLSFGVNVAKVQKVFQYDASSLTQVPDLHPDVMGVIVARGETYPLLNLSKIMGIKTSHTTERKVVVILHLNKAKAAILVDGIDRIHRISWKHFIPLHELCTRPGNIILGSFNNQVSEIMVIDFEKIMGDIIPSANIALLDVAEENHTKNCSAAIKLDRAAVKIVHADDSISIRAIVQKLLGRAGYHQLKTFENGYSAYSYLKSIHKKAINGKIHVNDEIHIVLTDIEMPQMDGLTLCKKIRNEFGWHLPVIMFSSLIDDQMVFKCQSVGATTQLSKTDIRFLSKTIDRLLSIHDQDNFNSKKKLVNHD